LIRSSIVSDGLSISALAHALSLSAAQNSS